VLRLLGFFVAVVVALNVRQRVRVIGGFFHGFLGFWLAAIGLSVAFSRLSAVWLARRRLQQQIAALGHVDNPHVRGKRGVLLLACGRAARALPDLEEAARGEPEVVEWRYRLGLARLQLGAAAEAASDLAQAAAMAPEHAYGGVQLALASAEQANGRVEKALAAIDTFESAHGATPESAYRRGVLFKRLGRAQEARASFSSVSGLYAQTPRFQRRAQSPWLWRARFAGVFG